MGPAGLCARLIGGSRRSSLSLSLLIPFAYQYHWPSGTVKYRHDEVVEKRERNATRFSSSSKLANV
jgi:hypothetical protein